MGAQLLQAQALGKLFGFSSVLLGVQLTVAPRQAIVIVGENGSGKSTLIKLFAGLMAPSSGRVLLFGHDSRRLDTAQRRKLGVLTHQSWLYPHLTARENLEFFGRLYGVPEYRREAGEWLTRVGLSRAADTRARNLSRGMEQRLALARVMIGTPELLLLDEPFAALDPSGVAIINQAVKDALSRDAAVIMTAHAPLAIADLGLESYDLIDGRLLPITPERDTDREHRRGRLRSLLGR